MKERVPKMSRSTTTVIISTFTAAVAVVLIIVIATRASVIASGCFHQVAHIGSGCARLVEAGGGRARLELTDFATAEGTDLRVMLSTAPDPLENSGVQRSETLDLGPLKKTEGSQEYDVPPIGNLSDFHSVTIWDSKHEVNFTTAPLR